MPAVYGALIKLVDKAPLKGLLVRDIQKVTINGAEKNFYSFATKYCSHHKPLDYPIFDSYVEKILKYFRDKDGFADYFFPGTSTVQTRAKYFLIVPFVLKEAGSGAYGSDVNTILRKIDEEERSCRDILIKTSSDGVIGSMVPHSWVLRTPSNIYWNGIKKMGIFKASDLSVKEYVHQTVIQRTLKKAKAYGNRDKEAEENEKDDIDAGDIISYQFWSLGDTYQKDCRYISSI